MNSFLQFILAMFLLGILVGIILSILDIMVDYFNGK